MNKPSPEIFEKYFTGIREDGSFEFKKGILKHFPSRKEQATAWAQEIIQQAMEQLAEKYKKEEGKNKKSKRKG